MSCWGGWSAITDYYTAARLYNYPVSALIIAAVLLGQAAQGDRRLEAVEKGLTLPSEQDVASWSRKGAHYKRALDILLDRAHWTKALAAIEERTGLWEGGPIEVKVAFRELKEPAVGSGAGGRGEVGLDVERLAKYEKGVMDYEKIRDKVAVVTPPARTDRIVYHELTHCFQDGKQPTWLLEGTATFVAQDGHFVAFFRQEGIKVKDVDAEYEHRHKYARGWAFLEYVKAKHGDAALKKLLAATMKEGAPVEKAAAEATGLEWDKLKAVEREWSARWVSTFKVQK